MKKLISTALNAYYGMGTDEFREGASDVAVRKRYDAAMTAEAAVYAAYESDQKRIAALEEALKPFAGIAFEYWPKEPEYFDVSMKRSLIQKARVALATANAQVPRE